MYSIIVNKPITNGNKHSERRSTYPSHFPLLHHTTTTRACPADLPVFWTEACRRGLTLHEVSRLMSASTARLAGLHARKGALRAGLDADLVVWDPEQEWTITKEDIIFKNKAGRR